MNSLRRRRGVSGIISGVFLVAVALMIFGAMISQYTLFEHYNETVQKAQQRAWERFNERLAIVTVETGVSKLNFTVKNCGSVTAHVVDIYMSFTNDTRTRFSVDVWVNPGSTVRISNAGPTLQTSDVYDFQIATTRGNLFAPFQATISNQPTPGGSQPMPFIFGFGYDDFQYRPASGGDWNPAWRIPNSINAHFQIYLRNTYKQAVTIISFHTRLTFMPDPAASQTPLYTKLLSSITIPAEAGAWLSFTQDSVNFPNKKDVHYFVYTEVYYYFTDPNQILGTNVGVLSCYTI
jgi:archaellum component FlaF (FlaF/FlaG flagellin family)